LWKGEETREILQSYEPGRGVHFNEKYLLFSTVCTYLK
jgi:hypothetical protein